MTIEHQEIKQILRQRTPFLLVDRILEMDGERAVGIKNVTGTEPYLVGHFPDEPILPGVLLLEAMSQVGGSCWPTIRATRKRPAATSPKWPR